MGGFDRVANLLFEKRKITHLVVLLMTLLMIPGLPISLTPADIESYDLESGFHWKWNNGWLHIFCSRC
jgi:hypothetical protein